jgi:small GTP-binding protein
MSDILPAGITSLRVLIGHQKGIQCLIVTPDGRKVISGGSDHAVCVWELESGRLLETMKNQPRVVLTVAVTPNGCSVISGGEDGAVSVWDLESGRLLRTLEGDREVVTSVTVTPDGQSVIGGGWNGMVWVWELESGKLTRSIEGHSGTVCSVAVKPDGQSIVSGGWDGKARVWELASGRLLQTMEGDLGSVSSVAVTPDGQSIVAACEDKTVRVWDASSGRPIRTLEGHNSNVVGLAISRDGRWAATDSVDNTVRIWELVTGRSVAVLPVATPHWAADMRVAFTPDGAHLLTVAGGEAGEVIRVWSIDFAQLEESQLAQDSISYRNAKVVLVGDTGVGKSGLGMVLAGEKFRPTDSTHGRRVWSFDPTDVSVEPGRQQRREILLWDLAGQPGYRLVHHVNIDQAVVALVVVDARNETDPLGVAEYWARAIAQARSTVPITKFLIVARIDRGGLAVNAEDLERFARQHGFAGVFQTSAKTGEGVPELADAIRGAIQWEELEEVGSNRLFVSIRQFLQQEKARGDKALVERGGRSLQTMRRIFRPTPA